MRDGFEVLYRASSVFVSKCDSSTAILTGMGWFRCGFRGAWALTAANPLVFRTIRC